MIKLWPGQAQFRPFYHLIFKYDLDLQLTWTNDSNDSFTPQRELFWKRFINEQSYGPDKLNLWPFYHLTFKCDLDLQPLWTNVSNGTSTFSGQRLCKIILKSMHKYTSYGPDKSGRTHNARTYTELKLKQICLAYHKRAQQQAFAIANICIGLAILSENLSLEVR